MSTYSARPDALISRGDVEHPGVAASERRVELDRHDPGALAQVARQPRLLLDGRGGDGQLALGHVERRARPAALVHGGADRGDLGGRRPAAAADERGAELDRLGGELREVLGRGVREDDPAAGEPGQAEVRQRGQRRAVRAHPLERREARLRPRPVVGAERVHSELPEPQCRLPRRHARERLPVLVEGQQGDDRQRRDRADGVDRRLELVEVVERLDEEQVDAARREQFRLLGKERAPLLLRVAHVAERPDRPGDEHLLPGHLTGLAGDLDPLGVDALDVVLEEARRELEAVGAERVRLDQLGTRADEAEVQ